MGSFLSRFVVVPSLKGILRIYDIVPFSNYWKYRNVITGLIKLVVHRALLNRENLYRAPFQDDPRLKNYDGKPLKTRPADGFGADVNNPTTANYKGPIGRNMPAIPKHLRDPQGAPDVQMVAQRLLAREQFKPAADQLNILAASWIQAMVHDWINHLHSDRDITLDKGAGVCPLKRFSFKATLEREDGCFDSGRTQWWDASFLYGNNDADLERARTKNGGKLKTNQDGIPHILPEDPKTGLYTTGDNENSWVGVTVLQELFLKEHNYVAEQMSNKYPDMTDEDIFNAARLVIAALVAKVHTADWTVELLKTNLLQVGMWTNWYGLPKALVGTFIRPLRDYVPTSLLSLIGRKQSDNKGVPYCLTEEFAAVYRLHSLSPPGLVVGEGDKTEFVPLLDLFSEKGARAFHKSPSRPTEITKSVLSYPCGGLYSSNYPVAYRQMTPTNIEGKDFPESRKIDLAALDLFRDRERGIRKFNDFRRELHLKPYKSFMELTGGIKADARKLELIYGPGKEGVERCDLLVGDMYEKKPTPSFALSETSFIVFLAMASRRLESDPYLNEYYTEEYYTKFGLDHIKSVEGLLDILDRHYPALAKDFKHSNGKAKQSAFKPTLGPADWEAAIDKYVDVETKNEWKRTKEANERFFDAVEKEAQDFVKSKNV